MTQTIREYIKENGRKAARLKFGDRIDDMQLQVDGRKVGLLKRYKHEQYGTWTWEASIVHNGNEYTFIDFDSQTNCIDWAHRKIEALNNPKFGTQLRESIASSPMTVDAISKVANCSRFAIHKWMRSESYPPIHTTNRIAKAISPMGWPMLFDSWCEQIELEQ